MRYGTPAQQQYYLPKVLACEHIWAQGYSEPNAGSDLASVATRAVQEGDDFVIDGRKIWTSNAPVADYCIVFAVTDPERAAARRGGISAFLVPTASPGFAVQRVIKLFGHIGGDDFVVLAPVEVASATTN